MPWASLSGYYPGMSKRQAQMLGLKDCKSRGDREVRCLTAVQTRVQTLHALSTEVTFDVRTQKATRIEAHFDPDQYGTLVRELVSRFGEGTRGPSKTCFWDEWDKKDDYRVTVHICLQRVRHITERGAVVRLLHEPGRKAHFERLGKSQQRQVELAKSFNSK